MLQAAAAIAPRVPKTKSPCHTVVILLERDVGQQLFLCNFLLSEANLTVALRKAQHALASQVSHSQIVLHAA